MQTTVAIGKAQQDPTLFVSWRCAWWWNLPTSGPVPIFRSLYRTPDLVTENVPIAVGSSTATFSDGSVPRRNQGQVCVHVNIGCRAKCVWNLQCGKRSIQQQRGKTNKGNRSLCAFPIDQNDALAKGLRCRRQDVRKESGWAGPLPSTQTVHYRPPIWATKMGDRKHKPRSRAVCPPLLLL